MLSVVCSREILCRATVLIYLQGITAKDFYYSYVEKHRSCWELVGNLLQSEVPVWEILNCDQTRSSHFVRNLDRLAGQPFHFFLACQILDPDFQISCQIFYVFPCVVESSDLSTRKQHHILAPWTPIAKPEEVMAAALGQQSTKS